MFDFEKFIAPARFEPYANARPAIDDQRALYLWNRELAQELNRIIGHTEVFIREAIDRQLRDWNLVQPRSAGRTHNKEGVALSSKDPRRRHGGGTTEWLKYPAPTLSNLLLSEGKDGFKSEYNGAMRRAQNVFRSRSASHPRFGAAITHDDLLAHLTLGAWVRLLPEGRLRIKTDMELGDRKRQIKKSQLDLWGEALCRAFPFEENPYVISHRLSQICVARNRVAHQESLLNTDVPRIHRAAIRLALAIDPGLGSWLANESKVIECWKRQP